MIYLIICFIIDGVDGSLARAAKVKEVLPDFNGKNMDYVIDFASYAIIPSYFFYEAQMTTPTLLFPTAIIMLVVAVLYYGKQNWVSDDMHFVGFPVLWNFVVFFQFFVLDLGGIANSIIIAVLAVLHFLPIKFLYPSRTEKTFLLNVGVTVILVVSAGLILWIYPKSNSILNGLAIFGMAYYLLMSLWNTLNAKS